MPPSRRPCGSWGTADRVLDPGRDCVHRRDHRGDHLHAPGGAHALRGACSRGERVGGGSCACCAGLLVGGGDRPPGPATERDDERSGEVGTVESVVVSSAARWGLVAQFPTPLKCRSAQTGQAFRGAGNCATSHDATAAARQPDPAPHDANGPAAERQRTDGPAPTHGAGPSRCSGVDQPARISRASFAVSVGVLPTLTPAASRASFFAAAVPEDPETMAPAWPIVLPSGAVKPAT